MGKMSFVAMCVDLAKILILILVCPALMLIPVLAVNEMSAVSKWLLTPSQPCR